MTMYIMPSRAAVEPTLARVAAYTRGDRYAAMDGRLTFSSHWHAKLTVAEGGPHPRAPDFVRALEAMNVNLVHLAEFHGDGHASDPGPLRLPELKGMFDLCRRYADGRILLMPGEEANAHFPGHWLYFFPKPVYLTLVHPPGAPFLERLAPYGDVYHVGSEPEMAEVLRREKGLAWTAHPRIKGSAAAPDLYRDRDWYRDDLWLGGTWKAMPADLSEERLGRRSLDLLDDMNQWGQRKQVLGEADLFDIDPTHELWGHMNVNYLRLARMPTCDDWSPVLDVLRRGDFFVTTGEVLIHSFDVKDGKAIAELSWTFPLSHVALVTSDGTRATRRLVALPDTTEHGRRRFEWPLDLAGVRWVRLEAWDVARNTAFTQPLWR
jgi:hypothetical protein